MFTFLRYISPTWYFHLTGKNYQRYWVRYDHLGDDDRHLLDVPECYSSQDVAAMDLAYQAWCNGVIADESEGMDVANIEPDVRDQYRFLRRHFFPAWSAFVLLIRLLELNNPVSEIRGFFSARKVERLADSGTKDWGPIVESSNSPLLSEEVRVSVIIPTLNRYTYLEKALRDLEKQSYKNFEVLVVDQSEPYDEGFYESFDLDLKVWNQEEKALWLARNSAIRRSEGELILLYDDDSRVEPDWIESHIRCLDAFDADISSGVSISAVGAKVPKTYSYYKWSDQVDTGNVMIRKSVFHETGLFDRQFERQRQGDGEFGLRAYLAGFKNISNPDAKRIHLKAGHGGLRQVGAWDAWRPSNFFSPRPVPSVFYFVRKYFGNRAAAHLIARSVLPSFVPYRFKGSPVLLVLGSLLTFLILPVAMIPVIRSWRASSLKLEEGALIGSLE